MARISPISLEAAQPQARAELEHQIAAHGRTTNMKCTLARSPAALQALMEWYSLYDVVLPVLGQRMTTLFSHAISSETDCLICSTFFRRWLSEQGEDPDALVLGERERDIVAYGRQLVQNAHLVSDELFGRLRSWLSEEQLVALTAFGGMMIATNVFNNALQIDLDDYLQPFRKTAAAQGTKA